MSNTTLTGKEFRMLRDELHLTQQGLAQELDVHLSTIQNYESGRRKIPRYRVKSLMLLMELKNATQASGKVFKTRREIVEYASHKKEVSNR